ncbi:contractile injection system tape measure protein [Vibrio mangrovi]|uniref:Contractile injection system tape measure protein n=1 Tax=Vibrio mangrovi TaxID=474394 RepID=A0A1Y6IYR6_9VIBR|nr:contractile injection system tape measure protein [Vibrio mangrovi]MDW6002500.1 contractile injection system tape measure protein [Vibrio mangrovi]SMS01970.1 hypothetical protein VIM7927_03281 [Vibrio mangrovi]
MARHEHIIAQCQWQTCFDDRDDAVALQNALSQWSNQVLPGILSRCFEQHCPAAQIWRIDRLELNLGTIALQDLDRELPQRVREAAEEALMQLFRQHRLLPYSGGARGLQILDLHMSALTQLRWFLLHGTLPWWEQGLGNPVFMVDQQIEQQPHAVAELLRQVGSSAVVRRRIVWQWGESRIRRTIQILEPWHADFIHRYADNLALSQQQQPFTGVHLRELKSNIWYWILTHLLVERGTLFNTLQFVRSTLFQMAQHYQLDFSALLHNLSDVARQMLSLGLMGPRFLQVLVLLEEHEQPVGKATVPEEEPDLWQLLQQMLHHRETVHRETNHQQGMRPVYLHELFTRLAGSDAARTARIIRAEGRSEAVRLHLLQQFDQEQLQTLVAVIAPGDQLFIRTHVRHTQTMLREQHLDPQLIWRILLDYLLASSGSYFNRRQLVQTTLTGLSRQYHLDYALLLAMLVRASVQWQLTPHHFELLAILQELQRATLSDHDAGSVLRLQQEISGESDVDPMRILIAILHLHPEIRHRSFLHLYRQQGWQGKAPGELSRFLVQSLAACDRLNLSEIQALLSVLAPQDGFPAFELLTVLHQHHRQGYLAYLPPSDPMEWLTTLMVEALLEPLKRPGQVSRWQEQFLVVLERESGLASHFWRELFVHLKLKSQTGQSGQWFEADGMAAELSDRRSDSGQILPALSQSSTRVFATLMQLLQPSSGHQPVQDVILTTIIDHPDAVSLLIRLSHNPEGQRWLAPLLPVSLRRESSRRQLLQALMECVSEVCGKSPSGLAESLQRSFWQIWVREIRAYRALHHHVIGFAVELSGWVTSLLRLWARQRNVRWSVLAQKIRQQRPQDAPAGLDWMLVLAQLNTVRNDTEFEMSDVRTKTMPQVKAPGHPEISAGHHRTETPTQMTGEMPEWYQDSAGQYLRQPAWTYWLTEWLKSGQLPVDVSEARYIDWQQALLDWLHFYPESFRQRISGLSRFPVVHHRLLMHLSLAALLDVMERSPKSLQVEIQTIQVLEQLLLQLNLPQMSVAERQQHLLSCVLDVWLSQRWQDLTGDALVAALFWKILQSGTVSPQLLVEQLSRSGLATTYALEVSVREFADVLRNAPQSNAASPMHLSESVSDSVSGLSRTSLWDGELREVTDEQPEQLRTIPMAVLNAGLVLIQSFIPAFFERLHLTQDNQFITPGMQRRAVHCLQVLATGVQESGEHLLLLNKVLCGLSLSEPVEAGIHLSAEETDIVHSLIEAVINYWPAIGKTSIDGFRGNWLVRNGTLTESQDHWDLIVEKRPYDILITRAPLSYSIIRLPWMKKPIYVTWPT